jgi:dipeptidyl-peptidase-4
VSVRASCPAGDFPAILTAMKTTTLAAVLSVAVISGGLASPGSPAAEPPQGPALDTSFLRLYAETRGFMLGRPQKPKITPDGKAVLFLRAEAKTPKLKLYEFDVASGQTKELLSPELLLQGADENLTPEEKARRERQRVTVGGFTDFHLDPDGKRVLVKLSNKLYVFDRAAGKATELKTGEGGAIVDPKWSPDGKLIAYVRGYDVYAYDPAAGKEWAVTTGGTAVKTHGLAEFVAQEEMDRHSGFWWSPDSKSIAFEEADHTGVEQWHVADPFKPGTEPSPQYYPRPGGKNVAVRLGVIPVTGGETVWVEWDRKRFEDLGRVAWGKKTLLIVVQSRKQDALAFIGFDPRTGKLQTEHPSDPAAARPGVTMDGGWLSMNLPGNAWLPLPPEPKPFTDRDGFLCLMPSVGNWSFGGPEHRPFHLMEMEFQEKTTAYVPGFEVDDVVSFDEKRRRMILTARTDPTQTHVFRLDRDEEDKKVIEAGGVQLTTEPGVHAAVVSKDQTLAVFTSTTLKNMPVSKVGIVEGGWLGTLPSVALDPPFVPNVTVEKVGDYWTGVVRPRDFDPKKKYPVVVSVYGGPTSLVVTRAMQPWLIRQWLADQGFVVVAIDNRGTPGRGRDWEKAVYQKFGTVPLEDQVKGLHALCEKFPELDRKRVGVVGWSFGGYMAANAVLRRPDVFKAAVAGAPVTDWEDYDTHYTERYMGLLPESKAAYDEASLIPLAKDLRRPLLLVHGTADDNVYFRHTLKLTDALFRAGRDFEVLPLPGVTHTYTSDPVVMERLWAKTATFFKTHLGEAK